MKTSENLWFYDVFRENQKGTMGRKGLRHAEVRYLRHVKVRYAR